MQRRNRKHWMWGHLDTQPEIFQLLFFAKCTINKVFQESHYCDFENILPVRLQ